MTDPERESPDGVARATVPRVETNALRKWVTIAGIGLIALIVATDSYEAWQDYRTIVNENRRVQLAMCRALAEQTARMVQEIDVVLTDFADWRVAMDGAHADETAMRERLRTMIMQLPFVHSAAVAGADGRVLASTQTDSVSGLSLQRREVFTVPERAHDNSLYIGKPFIGKRDGTRSFALSRRINGPDGEFAGIVVARVSFTYLAALYSGVSVTPDTAIRLLREDGTTLAEYPPSNQSASSVAMDNGAFSGDPTRSEESGTVRSAGGDRTEVLHRVDGYPMIVEVSRSVTDVLRPWMQQESASAARTLSLAVLAALLLIALRRALARHDRYEAERRRLEQELESVHRAEALGFLAASVAHDFNNVLTAIVGYAELTRRSLTNETTAAVNLERLLLASERARLLVRKVLTFDPHRSLNYLPLRIEPVIREVAQQVQATLPAVITLKLDVTDQPVTVLGDATEIHQVAMNLCSNAIHAMTAGGTLEMRLGFVELNEEREVALGRLRPGPWVCLSILDSGVGMAAEQIKSVFEPFYTTRQPGQGTGIGMTVVRNIMMRMNGALAVDSTLGAGTRMSLYWPRIAEASAPAEQTQREGGGEAILVIDDEVELVALAEDTLASLGYEPVGFSDARAALEAFRRDPARFDAVLTDERMQPMRGLELARCILDLTPAIPVVLMTGHRDADIDVRARQLGIVEILDKPLRAATLQAALMRHLAARQPR